MPTEKKSFYFVDCPLKSACVDIADSFGVFVSFAGDLADKNVSGNFKNIDIESLLKSLSIQVNSKYSTDGKIFYIGENDFSEKFVLIGRSSLRHDDLEKFLQSFFMDGGDSPQNNFFAFDNCFYCYDTQPKLKALVDAVKRLDQMLIKSYIAEVFFIRVNNSDLLDLQARFDATGIDILKQSWSLKDLFNCYVDADAGRKSQKIIQRPILYLSEGKQAELTVGTDLTLEKKAISTEGYTSTTGWQTFSDGLKIALLLKRVKDGMYSIDFELSISKYADNGDTVTGVIPKIDKTSLKQGGVVVPSGEPVLLGALSSDTKEKKLGFVSVGGGTADDSILVFLRVRELDLNQKKLPLSGQIGIDNPELL